MDRDEQGPKVRSTFVKYRFTRIPSHVSVRYRFALVKVRRPSPSDSLILLVACPARCCPSLLFTALDCPLLPSAALYFMEQWLIKRSGRYRLGYRLGID